ncbi:MAG: GNAT family N-acetyltransferase [Lachnospiraceae bacterium]|nr:GNAT family N-acetyltransferase [Lachnospiraceae bacterium]
MKKIRKSTIEDASRIAEILIFTKRMNYRSIYQDDIVSFGEMQVYPLAKEYIQFPDKLSNIWVYEDEFVKGIIHIESEEVLELYVDSFFQNQGIGSELLEFAVKQMGCRYLWVLEKNIRAIKFYKEHSFRVSDERELVEGTKEYVVKMERG